MTEPRTLYMETTQIAPIKTAGEIQSLLVQMGAHEIAQTYRDGKVVGLRFLIDTPYGSRLFSLPVRTEPVFQFLWKRDLAKARYKRNFDTRENQAKYRHTAERVAWRQLLRWVQAQFAMIETGMVQSAEVFLPYMQGDNGKTLFEVMVEKQFKALPAGS